ncbi:N-acetylmuramic acid 6-phosphate etherase [Bacteroidota bacterium]
MPESDLFNEINGLHTEQKNPRTENIDLCSAYDILDLINKEDMLIALAVREELGNIEKAVDGIIAGFKYGGRLFYVGAGTSGRLGILDASECPPTFGSEPEMVQGIIAGGKEAVFRAQEGAEDKPENGANEIIERNIKPPDIVCGIAASGRTPFVKGALSEAKIRGCFTILVTTVTSDKINELGVEADVMICPKVGPEVIAGSTRMKSGTAQKIVLNMLTTASMIRLGKTYANVMVDLQLTNDKLKERAKKIVMSLTGLSYDEAEDYLNRSDGHVKTALVMIKAGVTKEKASVLLNEADGFVRVAIENSTNT